MSAQHPRVDGHTFGASCRRPITGPPTLEADRGQMGAYGSPTRAATAHPLAGQDSWGVCRFATNRELPCFAPPPVSAHTSVTKTPWPMRPSTCLTIYFYFLFWYFCKGRCNPHFPATRPFIQSSNFHSHTHRPGFSILPPRPDHDRANHALLHRPLLLRCLGMTCWYGYSL